MITLTVPGLLIVLLFLFGSSIFYTLLLIERSTWKLVSQPESASAIEQAVRFVHLSLKNLIPVLPPSNGVVVVGGLACIIWQAARLHWSWQSLGILAFWSVGQLYILTFGRIAQAMRDVWRTPSDGSLADVSRGGRRLIQEHRNGLLHALGVLLLEMWLILTPHSIR